MGTVALTLPINPAVISQYGEFCRHAASGLALHQLVCAISVHGQDIVYDTCVDLHAQGAKQACCSCSRSNWVFCALETVQRSAGYTAVVLRQIYL